MPTQDWQYRVLFEDAVDAILVSKPPAGLIVEANAAASRLLGYPREVLRSMAGLEIIAPELLEETVAAWVQQVEAQGSFQVETLWVARDGTRLPVSVAGRPIELDGEPHFLITARDLSDWQRAREERRELEEQLHRVQRMESLGMLAGGVAHDFNNILQAMQLLVEVSLLDAADGSSVHGNLVELDQAVRRATGLVDQLVSYARTSGQRREPCDIGALGDEVCRLVRATLPAGASLEVERDANLPPLVGNPDQLHQVLLNLVTNACKAIGDTGTVELRVRAGEVSTFAPTEVARYEHVVVDVTDDGVGIPAENLHRVFEPFFSTRGAEQGTGLGLAVVRSIVDDHLGDISVESTLGVGTRFRVRLPAGDAAPVPTDPSPPRWTPEDIDLHVIYVDDEPVLLDAVATALRRAGARVTASGSIAEALDHLDGSVDVVVSDLARSEADGLALARAARAKRSGLPVLLLTTDEAEELGVRAAEAGVTAVLRKPIVPSVLLRTVLEVTPRR